MVTKGFDDYYDVIVIGAGIGGLVSSVFLAKEGFSVLVVEQGARPGGYCTSFKRDGFTFDIGLHAIGSCREDGLMGRIISDLKIKNELKFVRSDPVDKIITQDSDILIRKDFNKTIDSLKAQFPGSADKMDIFFKLVSTNSLKISSLILNKTFQDVLNELFINIKLKGILSLLLLEMGLSPLHISAIAAFGFYREFIMDRGYYPIGGMQAIPNTFVKRLRNFGGKLVLSKKVTKILIANGVVKGVILEDGVKIKARYVVSNAAARQTFFNLIGKEYLDRDFVKRLENMKISTSAFLVFLGVNLKLKSVLSDYCTTWYYPYSNENVFSIDFTNPVTFMKQAFDEKGFVMLCSPSVKDPTLAPSGCESLILAIGAPFISEEFWRKNKSKLTDILIKRAEQIIPGLSNHIIVQDAASPVTLYKYTLNTYGASCGWAQVVTHAQKGRFGPDTPIENLYLAGHWAYPGAGIAMNGVAMAAYSGRLAAKSIIRKEKTKCRRKRKIWIKDLNTR